MKRLFLLPLLLSGASALLAAPPAKPPRGTKWFLSTQYSGAIRRTLKGGDPELQSRDRYENNGLYGFADTAGREIVAPRYDYAGDFRNGYATVGRGKGLDRKFGLIDTTGREVTPCEWDDVGTMRDGRAAVQQGVGTAQRYGFIDRQGRLVIPVRYDLVRDFREGCAVAAVGKWPEMSDAYRKERLQGNPNYKFHPYETDYFVGKFGFIDTLGREIVAPAYDDAGSFSEGLASVGVQGKYYIRYGYVDTTGRLCIPPLYYEADAFNEGLARVGRVVEGKIRYGLIDRSGKPVVPLRYDSATSCRNGAIWVGEGEYPDCRYTLLDRNGERLLAETFYDVNDTDRSGGYASAAIRDGDGRLHYGVLSSRGKVILPFEYDRITLFVEWDPAARCYIECGIAELNGQSFTFTLKSK